MKWRKHSLVSPRRTVRLTALPGYGDIRLFAVIERFREMYPRIVCDVELTDSYLDLSSGEIDVALRATDDPPDYLVAKKLHSHRFVMVASPDYLKKNGRPKMVADMAHHVALAYRGSSWRQSMDGHDVYGRTPHGATEVGFNF